MGLIFLTGFMGAGKSTVGRLVADDLDARFVDMDDVIIETVGMTINDIFRDRGEAWFRDVESQVLQNLAGKDSLVISTGGGVIERDENRAVMMASGTVVFIDTPWDVIMDRLSLVKDRPLAKSAEGWEKIRRLYEKREPLYRQAHFTIEADHKTPDQVSGEIVKLVCQ